MVLAGRSGRKKEKGFGCALDTAMVKTKVAKRNERAVEEDEGLVEREKVSKKEGATSSCVEEVGISVLFFFLFSKPLSSLVATFLRCFLLSLVRPLPLRSCSFYLTFLRPSLRYHYSDSPLLGGATHRVFFFPRGRNGPVVTAEEKEKGSENSRKKDRKKRGRRLAVLPFLLAFSG